jgi:formylglycine-generating enzyme required for sulfatase activity
MGKYPITQAQWRIVAAYPPEARELNPNPANFRGDNRPVEQVSWEDATEFCSRLSKKTGREYRLPSEAKWEYACRAGTTTDFYFGDTLTPKLARCKSNLGMALLTMFSGETAPVGSYPPNAFGLYDMHGNVWEWCEDDWHSNYEGNPPVYGSAWKSNEGSSTKILRGVSGSTILLTAALPTASILCAMTASITTVFVLSARLGGLFNPLLFSPLALFRFLKIFLWVKQMN